MRQLFWLIEGRIAGYNGELKPAWDLVALKAQGIDAILSLTAADNCDPNLCRRADLRYQCISFAHHAPPQIDDLAAYVAQVPKALSYIRECERDKLAVMIYCDPTKDSSGLLMAYLLMVNGAAPLHAVNQVRALKRTAFSAEGWDQFVFDLLYALQAEQYE